jgi:hypothetical protein
MVPSAGANSDGLTAATTRPCTETSRTRSVRATVPRRKRSLGTEILELAQRCNDGNTIQAMSATASKAATIIARCRDFGLACNATSCAEVSAIFIINFPESLNKRRWFAWLGYMLH